MDFDNALRLGRQRRFKKNLLAVKIDLPFILRVGTAHDVQKGTFARAVFSDKGVYLAASEFKMHMIQGLNRIESLADILHPQYDIAHNITLSSKKGLLPCNSFDRQQ